MSKRIDEARKNLRYDQSLVVSMTGQMVPALFEKTMVRDDQNRYEILFEISDEEVEYARQIGVDVWIVPDQFLGRVRYV